MSVSVTCLRSQILKLSVYVACLQTRCRQRLSADKTVCVRLTLTGENRYFRLRTRLDDEIHMDSRHTAQCVFDRGWSLIFKLSNVWQN